MAMTLAAKTIPFLPMLLPAQAAAIRREPGERRRSGAERHDGATARVARTTPLGATGGAPAASARRR